jgi:F-type H+-transporting ATPase subunit delta
VSETASISMGVASRYARAIFDLVLESDEVAELENNVDSLSEALGNSQELRDLIASPLYTRDDQKAAIVAIGTKMKLLANLTNTLALMASKRRLFVMDSFLRQLKILIAEHKGEITADVVSAKSLTQGQSDKLAKAIKDSVGKEIKINASVDESIIGGIVIKVGSKMIDTSIRSKLNSLQTVMKEVG